MPDIRQWAEESLLIEQVTEPVFAELPAPEPLEDEVQRVEPAPPMSEPSEGSEYAELDIKTPPQNELDTLETRLLPGQGRPVLNPPDRPQAREFSLPLEGARASDIEPLGMPSRPGQAGFQLPLNRPRPSETPVLPQMMREQRQYSELSIRDFLAEHGLDELPMPERTTTDYEPFPLPERMRTPEARLDTPFVPNPPRSEDSFSLEESFEPAGSFSAEIPFEVQEDVRITRADVADALQREQQLRFMSQE